MIATTATMHIYLPYLHVHEYKLHSNTNHPHPHHRPLSFHNRLPKENAPQFGPLLRALQDHPARYGCSSYGLSVTTLEEVFLAVTAQVIGMLLLWWWWLQHKTHPPKTHPTKPHPHPTNTGYGGSSQTRTTRIHHNPLPHPHPHPTQPVPTHSGTLVGSKSSSSTPSPHPTRAAAAWGASASDPVVGVVCQTCTQCQEGQAGGVDTAVGTVAVGGYCTVEWGRHTGVLVLVWVGGVGWGGEG